MYNNKDERNGSGRVVGIVMTALLHAAFFYLLFTVYIARVPSDNMIRLDLEIEADFTDPVTEELMVPMEQDTKPNTDPFGGPKPAPIEPQAPAEQSSVDNTGDVEVPVPPPVIDRRSLYHSSDQGTEAASEDGTSNNRTLYRGATDGQDASSTGEAVSSFSLDGRDVVGRLGEPRNTTNKEGRVVVEITVDQMGKVIKAKARARGSSVQDADLWKAAEDAASGTLFNTDTKAPIMQRGTITYIFRLR